jgi:hypothetical protein
MPRPNAQDLILLRHFINRNQLAVIVSNCRGEEGEWFQQKLTELSNLVQQMPKSYENREREATAWLHYFKGGADWWITEKDAGSPDDEQNGISPGTQMQAFGLADLYRDGGEVGYICIAELLENGVELDLHWTPKTLAEVRLESALGSPPETPPTVTTTGNQPQSRAEQFSSTLNRLLTVIREKAQRQFEYNERTNIPTGIIKEDESVGLALEQAIVGAWNELHGWTCEDAIRLAHSVLEDANCHTEAARLINPQPQPQPSLQW